MQRLVVDKRQCRIDIQPQTAVGRTDAYAKLVTMTVTHDPIKIRGVLSLLTKEDLYATIKHTSEEKAFSVVDNKKLLYHGKLVEILIVG